MDSKPLPHGANTATKTIATKLVLTEDLEHSSRPMPQISTTVRDGTPVPSKTCLFGICGVLGGLLWWPLGVRTSDNMKISPRDSTSTVDALLINAESPLGDSQRMRKEFLISRKTPLRRPLTIISFLMSSLPVGVQAARAPWALVKKIDVSRESLPEFPADEQTARPTGPRRGIPAEQWISSGTELPFRPLHQTY